MKPTEPELRNRFFFHRPGPDQIPVHEQVSQRTFDLAVWLTENCPEGRNLSLRTHRMKMFLVLLLLVLPIVGQTIPISGAPGTPAAFLWPVPPVGHTYADADGRAVQVDPVSQHLVRVRTTALFGALRLVTVPIVDGDLPSHPSSDPLTKILRLLSYRGISAESAPMTVTTEGPLASVARMDIASSDYPERVTVFGTLHHALGLVELEIVAMNGRILSTPFTIDHVGLGVVRFGSRTLLDGRETRLHFGQVRVFRALITTDGVAAHLQTAPIPDAIVTLPIDHLVARGILFATPSGRMRSTDRLLVDWDLRDGGGLPWTRALDSGGGKQDLAPYPRWDVGALLEPQAYQLDAIQAARSFPYGYFWYGPGGDWITPSTHPSGYCDGIAVARFRDFGGHVALGDTLGELNPWKTDPAHLPNAIYVPAIVSGSPALAWLCVGLGHGAAMQGGRGLAGRAWANAAGIPNAPLPISVINGRGPTGAEGSVAATWGPRGAGWVLFQRKHAGLLDATGRLDALAASQERILAAQYGLLDDDDSPECRYGRHVRPLFYSSVWGARIGMPPFATTSDGLAEYARALNSVREDRVSRAASSFQSAFLEMAIAFRMRDRELLAHATEHRARIILAGVTPSDAYVWPVVGPAGWFSVPRPEHYYMPGDVGLPAQARPLIIDAEGLNGLYGNSYTGYCHVGALAMGTLTGEIHREAYASWTGRANPVVERLEPEWAWR